MNMFDILVTPMVFHVLMSWLSAVAPWNIEVKVVPDTDPGVQLAIPTLNEVAPLNIFAKVVTFLTSHLLPTVAGIATPPSLKAVSLWNMEDILVTECVSHALKF